MQAYENSRFDRENERLFRLIMKNVRIKTLTNPLIEMLSGLGIAAIIFYGGYKVINGTSTPGNFFSFLAALLMLYGPIKELINVNSIIQEGIAAGVRVFDVIDMVPEIRNHADAIPLEPFKKEIRFHHVSFCYEQALVLKDINLCIRAGEIVAFVGMSGGGKTTLVNLIPRFYDVTDGQILIDGHDIKTVTLASLVSQIGIVTQQTFLFNDTVRNNIAYGDIQTSEDRIIAAAKAANAHQFIMRLP